MVVLHVDIELHSTPLRKKGGGEGGGRWRRREEGRGRDKE